MLLNEKLYNAFLSEYNQVDTSWNWNLHHVRKDPAGNKVQTPYQIPGTDVTLASYCDTNHGYLQVEITSQKTLTGKYISVPGPKDPHDAQPTVLDTFILNLT